MSKIPGCSPTKLWNHKKYRARFSKSVGSSSSTTDAWYCWSFAFFWQHFDRFLAKIYLRIFLAMPIIGNSCPAPCYHISSGLLRVESKHFRLSLCRYTSFTIPIQKCPLTLFKWTRSQVFMTNRHALFRWVHDCVTRNHSALSQTPVWRSRLDVTGRVHFVEWCDGSASIDVSFVHVNVHREPYEIWKAIEKCWGFLARVTYWALIWGFYCTYAI
jgi:hypothetical protein